jgi:hypothetical protein
VFAQALWAERAGLQEERADCLAKVLALDPGHEGAQKALNRQKQGGAWLSGAELLAAKGFVVKDGRYLLEEEARMLERRGAAAKAMTGGEKRVEELLSKAASDKERARDFALEALSGLESADKLRPALRMLRRGEPRERQVAAQVLASIGDVDVVRPLIYSAIMDREAAVRAESVKALVAIDHPNMLKPFHRALYSDVPQLRMNAAEGLGAIGGSTAVEYILRRVMSTGGIGTRNHFSSMTQMSYISDFDVEIAQAAQIGDPIVGTLREGVMLDTRVLGVREEWTEVERHVFYRSLKTATGKDFGEDSKAWKTWWDDEGRTAMAALAETDTATGGPATTR